MRENWALGHSASFKNTLARACRLIAGSCTWADQGAPNTHFDSAVENFHLGDPDGLLLRHAMLCQRRHPARLVGHEGDAVTRAEGHAVHAFVGLQVHGRFCGGAVQRRNRGRVSNREAQHGRILVVLPLAGRKRPAMVQHKNAPQRPSEKRGQLSKQKLFQSP